MSLKELEETGKQKQAKQAKIKQDVARGKSIAVLRQAKVNTLRLYYLLRPSGFILTIFLCAQIVAVFFLLSEIKGFKLASRHGGTYYDQAIDDYGIKVFAVITFLTVGYFILMQIIIPLLARKSFDMEQRNIESLPFPTENYFETIGQSSYRILMEIEWEKTPSDAYMIALVDGIKSKHKIVYRGTTSDKFCSVQVDFENMPKRSGYRFTQIFEYFRQNLLVPLHEEYGIKKIKFS